MHAHARDGVDTTTTTDITRFPVLPRFMLPGLLFGVEGRSLTPVRNMFSITEVFTLQRFSASAVFPLCCVNGRLERAVLLPHTLMNSFTPTHTHEQSSFHIHSCAVLLPHTLMSSFTPTYTHEQSSFHIHS